MAVRWLAKGGTETGLMAQAGWMLLTMIDRYVKASSEALAAAEFDRLDLGIPFATEPRIPGTCVR